MTHTRFYSTCLFCLFVAACSRHEDPAQKDAINGIRPTPDKTVTEKTVTTNTATTRQELDLSLDNISIENEVNHDRVFNTRREATENDNALFNTLSKSHREDDIRLTGNLLTDEDKLDEEEYLDSVDGLQINIKGSFD
jgi:hypothetical protein